MTRARGAPERTMWIDCRTCPVRGVRCDDCVVTALAGRDQDAPSGVPLDATERRAVAAFVDAGLVSPTAAARLRAEPATRRVRAVG